VVRYDPKDLATCKKGLPFRRGRTVKGKTLSEKKKKKRAAGVGGENALPLTTKKGVTSARVTQELAPRGGKKNRQKRHTARVN